MNTKVKKTLFSDERGKPEIIALVLYVVLLAVVCFFHEPWFDEAQAWQIARCATIKDILFKIPHYEGHPQLWYLILVPFAKLGAPYELSMHFITILFMSGTAALILFKSPFPRIFRCLIPFSFFYFYQYGVLSRCYSVLVFAMALVSVTFSSRDEKPLRHVLSMALLCSSHAYGIIISGMLCIAWLTEIFAEYKKSDSFGKLVRDKRLFCMLGLAVLAAFLILSIIPADDVYYGGQHKTLSDRLLDVPDYTLFAFDALFGQYVGYDALLKSTFVLIMDCVFGAAVLVFFIIYTKKIKHLLTFVLPYFTLLTFMIFKYVSAHHLGVVTAFFLFILWICGESDSFDFIKNIFTKVSSAIKSPFLKKTAAAALSLLCVSPVLSSVYAGIAEIGHEYSFSKDIADFIKANDLEELKIMVQYECKYDFSSLDRVPEEEDNLDPKYRKDYTNLSGVAATLLPYFDDNIFMNFNVDDKDITYMRYSVTPDSETAMELWREQGVPDVLIGDCNIDYVYKGYDLPKYVKVHSAEHSKIWKLPGETGSLCVFIREDLLDDYPGLENIDEHIYLDVKVGGDSAAESIPSAE